MLILIASWLIGIVLCLPLVIHPTVRQAQPLPSPVQALLAVNAGIVFLGSFFVLKLAAGTPWGESDLGFAVATLEPIAAVVGLIIGWALLKLRLNRWGVAVELMWLWCVILILIAKQIA